ncbi:MAG: ABC transporter permease [Opitutaceae bacterium]
MNLLRKLRALLGKKKLDAEMAEEMREHLERRTQANLAAGMSPDEARYAAQRSFGGVDQLKEIAREQRGWLWLEQFGQDLRFAVRGVGKARTFTAVAVLTLALGIGVSTAMFSVVYGVLLDPYPYEESNEIWAPEMTDTKTGRPVGWRAGDFLEMNKLPAVAASMATAYATATLSLDDQREIIAAPGVSGTAFGFLGVAPVLGRGLAPADFKANGEPEPVCVLSFKLWQRLFQGDRGVIGRTLILNEQPHAIIGVMPPRFGWYTSDGLWLPLPLTDSQRGVRPIVRFHPGTTPEVASQQLLSLVHERLKTAPVGFLKDGFSAVFKNYLAVSSASGEMRDSLRLLLYAVGFLLLIACVNVANLQLARGRTRSRELAVRLAIGASRGRLVRQLLTESVGMSLAGGVLGVLLALGLTQLIVALMPALYLPNEARVTMNGWVLLFSAGVSVLTGVLFGLAPALQSTRPDLTDALKDGAHGAGVGVAATRTRNLLVFVEVALSIVLLVGASLTIRGFVELQRIDRGFRSERLIQFRTPLVPTRYPTLEQRNGFARDFIERLRAMTGVSKVTLGALPGFEAGSGVTIAGQPKIPDGVTLNYVDSDYLTALGVTLREGRDLTGQDVALGARVAIINESAAKLWTDGVSPLGRVISIDSLIGGGATNLAARGAVKEVIVVGIFADMRARDKRRATPPSVLVPYTLRGPVDRSFLVRTHGEPGGIVSAVRRELRAMDSQIPMLAPRVIDTLLAENEAQSRFNLALFTAFAGIALALAAAGIYSVLSYHVAQRTREFGVRLALGAAAGDILRLVLGAGARLLSIGVVVGVGGSIALAQIVQSRVFNVPLLDPLALGAAVAVLSAVAGFACWWPARRAARVDPMVALRSE